MPILFTNSSEGKEFINLSTKEILKELFPQKVMDGIRGIPFDSPMKEILLKEGDTELRDYFISYTIPLKNGHKIQVYYKFDTSKTEMPLRSVDIFYNHNLLIDSKALQFKELCKEIDRILIEQLGEAEEDEYSESKKNKDLIWNYSDSKNAFTLARLIYKNDRGSHKEKVLKISCSKD